MTAVQPSARLLEARRTLHSSAPASLRRNGISMDGVDRFAALGRDRILGLLGDVSRADAGWAQLHAGLLVVRNSDALTPPMEDGDDPSMTIGIALGALVAAAVGDAVIDAGGGAGAGAVAAGWRPGARASEARTVAAGMASSLLGTTASDDSRERFRADFVAELDSELPGLDHAQAGWAIVALAAWVTTIRTELATPLARRRGLRRSPVNPGRASVGAAYAAALIGEAGVELLDRAA
jgi:hypothetical protein